MITPLKMLDIQADLVERCHHNNDFIELTCRTIELQMLDSVGARLMPEKTREEVANAFIHMRNASRLAYPFRVSREMTRMVAYAAGAMADDEQILPEDVPTPWGMAYFDGGLQVFDTKGQEIIIHWIVWAPAQFKASQGFEVEESGVVYWSFNDMIEGPDRFGREILNSWGKRTKAAAGRWGYVSMNHVAYGKRVGPVMLGGKEGPEPASNTLRYLLALWAISQQEIADVTEHKAVPQQKGMLKRAKIQPRVSTIALRRRASHHIHAEGEGHVHQVRYPVRGHWRNQAYGPGRALRRRIWIADQWRGPEDAPIVTRGKVYDVTR